MGKVTEFCPFRKLGMGKMKEFCPCRRLGWLRPTARNAKPKLQVYKKRQLSLFQNPKLVGRAYSRARPKAQLSSRSGSRVRSPHQVLKEPHLSLAHNGETLRAITLTETAIPSGVMGPGASDFTKPWIRGDVPVQVPRLRAPRNRLKTVSEVRS